jgi:hypothetical protein
VALTANVRADLRLTALKVSCELFTYRNGKN